MGESGNHANPWKRTIKSNSNEIEKNRDKPFQVGISTLNFEFLLPVLLRPAGTLFLVFG